ncbi:hypothetical protein BCPG3_180 [Bacillus phage BCPG3]|uniref:Uncharacterized protein n=1 Tax=Bacillus phage SalinJah TaxID=1837830 RepID=A0A173GBN7_9CAUD|nr:hypothetical protein SALINJAH_146 [Bacillus phage SalinJah]ANH50613.1 hypothetical protein SALINJAH_146 [Bacillus phage SalinJah]QSJ04497.1 hypothetical protein BCPG3_180 [Bacillus phage BCPG3]
MHMYKVVYYNNDLERTEVELDAKNLAMLEQIVNRIQYDKSKQIIITHIKWLGKK